MEKDYRIPVLVRSMTIIDCISNENKGIGFVELQSRLGVPKTTLFRILHTLEREDWIERTQDRYHLGYKMIHYGMVTLSRRNLRNVAMPFLRQLMEETGENAHLAVLSGKK
ncbi:MAG: helix-turn-helix domain-containing protein, partial [Spirochaetales bacterium]|nr:helix-turn-helix domain-containing protein [Spirochaetales bacterium]